MNESYYQRVMQQTARFNTGLLQQDMAKLGWQPADLAEHAEVARSTVSRFIAEIHQTNRTARKLASALGYSVRRYLRQKAAA